MNCDTPRFPAGPLCPCCSSQDTNWVAASGHGTVYSWIVVRHPVPADIYSDEVPYVVALIDLVEGVRMPTNLVNCDVDAITGGMKVEVVFKYSTPIITLPCFAPIADPT